MREVHEALNELRQLLEEPPLFGKDGWLKKTLSKLKKTKGGLKKSKGEKPAPYKKPAKWISSGGVVLENGKVWVIKPSNHYGPWAFPKGRVDEGENLKQAALREVWEETGLRARIRPGGYLGKGEGTMSVTHFFLMDRTGGSERGFDRAETERVELVTWEHALALFKRAGNKRDPIIARKAMKKLGVKEGAEHKLPEKKPKSHKGGASSGKPFTWTPTKSKLGPAKHVDPSGPWDPTKSPGKKK